MSDPKMAPMPAVKAEGSGLSGWLPRLQPLVAVLLGLSLGLAVTALAGESPWLVLKVLVQSSVGTAYDLGMTLFYATPLIFTGLSVAIAFQAGLFNIGAEGQLAFGALAAAAMGILVPGAPAWIAPILGIFAAIAGGAIWGFIPGYLRARRGSHEVINTIMLNFVAAGLTSWVTLYLLRSEDSQNPETKAVGAGYLLSHWTSVFGDAPLSLAFVLAILAAIGMGFFLWRTTAGFELRAVGQNESAARAAGIDAAKVRILAMVLAGGLAGMVGVAEVMGNAGKFRMNFSPDYGFIGIAVALLGRNRPLGVVGAALLFGALQKGTGALDFETEHVTRELSSIIQALVILSVSAEGLWTWMRERKKGAQA